jgi:hypothetical protein
MSARSLPNHWNLFGLRESPYFQDSLGEAGAQYPLELFVGRDAETSRLLAGIGGAPSSRQAIGGDPGIGKTTLAQLVKATAVENGYWATNELLPFYPDDTVQRVMGGVLGGLYDAIVTARPATAEHVTMQRAQQYVRAFRLSGGGVNVSILGVGGGGSRSMSAVTPAGGVLLDGPRLVRELLDLALGADAKGIVLHLNNLENLSERDVENAADILRSLRDPVLLQAGLHTILVGTTEAVTTATTSHAQLRSVFTLLVLDSLPLQDVQKLLAARYRHLRQHTNKRPIPPVSEAAVETLYPLFRGDLRGLLKALEEGATLLVGVASPGSSLTMHELAPALQQRYASLLAASLSATRFQQMTNWAEKLGCNAMPTQDDLKKLWKVSQAAVSVALKDLIQAGCVVTLPKQGVMRYALTGVSQLAFQVSRST